jgi:hypothetical protein
MSTKVEVGDASRFQWMLENPETGARLLNLLQQGKYTEVNVRSMADRLIALPERVVT